ncbi:ORF130 [Ranid herpesvirus 1]|uniref:ORF130 n=1 Tax=Ranid herpesvirus 1 TaxID=85655 RepID=Q14VK0_9VIRU|nr:ORF130 [Ranid herpesvirus 1]ABG25772.1 ORF130 [Ranid herpesvirus 1]
MSLAPSRRVLGDVDFAAYVWPYLSFQYDFENGPHECVLPDMFSVVSTTYEVMDAHLRGMSESNEHKEPWVTEQQISTHLRPQTLQILCDAYNGKCPAELPALPSLGPSLSNIALRYTHANYCNCREVVRCMTACLFARYAFKRPQRRDLAAQLYSLCVSLRNTPDLPHTAPPFDLVADPEVPTPLPPLELTATPLERGAPSYEHAALRRLIKSHKRARLHGWVAHAVAVVQHRLLCLETDDGRFSDTTHEDELAERVKAVDLEPLRQPYPHEDAPLSLSPALF